MGWLLLLGVVGFACLFVAAPWGPIPSTTFRARAALLALSTLCLTSEATAQQDSRANLAPESGARQSEHRPDITLTIVGAAMFVVPYVAGVGYATFTESAPRGMDPQPLYVPILGPVLAIRGVGCDDNADASCSTSGGAGTWALLVLDSVLQATGVVIAVVGLSKHKEVRVRHRQSIRVLPHPTGVGQYGVSAWGVF
ncbi:MAG: hypothetical protein HS104_32735 [Polyangiaceae bacterium]|nr:hypothetical protein [Polyangiaceae bacterium]